MLRHEQGQRLPATQRCILRYHHSDTMFRPKHSQADESLGHLATSSVAHDARTRRFYLALLFTSAFVQIIPHWLVRYVPLVDYPPHLVRAFELATYWRDSIVQSQYQLVYELTPNIGLDLLLPVIMQVLPMQLAGKLFLSATIIFYVFACHRLGRSAHGNPTWMAIPASLVFINSTYLYGFINFCFGVALFLISFAKWLEWRNSWSGRRHVLFLFLVVGCYLVHLTSFAALAASVVACAMRDWVRDRNTSTLLRTIAPFAVPVVAALTFTVGGAGSTGLIVWSTPKQKLVLLLGPILTYSKRFDAVQLIVLLSFVLLLYWKRRTIRLNPELLLPAGIIFLAFLASPAQLLTSSGADARAVPPMFALSILSVSAVGLRSYYRVAFYATTSLLLLRVVTVGVAWRSIDHLLTEQVALMERIPERASLYPLFYVEDFNDNKTERPLAMSTSYAAASRHAITGTHLTISGQNLLVFRHQPPRMHLSREHPWASYDWNRYLSFYDYFWIYGLDADLERFLLTHSDVVATAGKGKLLKVRK